MRMKRFFWLPVFASLVVCLMYSLSHAAGVPVTDTPINAVGTPVTIAVSSTSWTKVPTTNTTGRLGFFVDVSTTSTHPVAAHIGNCTSTAIATTVRPFEFIATEGHYNVPIMEDLCLWMLSLNTGASTANVHIQEYKR